MPTRSGLQWNNVVAAGLVAILCVVASVLARSAARDDADWKNPPSNDFPVAGGSYTNQRYSTLDQINTGNIQKLGGAWMIHVEEKLATRREQAGDRAECALPFFRGRDVP